MTANPPLARVLGIRRASHSRSSVLPLVALSCARRGRSCPSCSQRASVVQALGCCRSARRRSRPSLSLVLGIPLAILLARSVHWPACRGGCCAWRHGAARAAARGRRGRAAAAARAPRTARAVARTARHHHSVHDSGRRDRADVRGDAVPRVRGRGRAAQFDRRSEVAAATLGASRFTVFRLRDPPARRTRRRRGSPAVLHPLARRVRCDDHVRGQPPRSHADPAGRDLPRAAARPGGRDRPGPDAHAGVGRRARGLRDRWVPGVAA